MTNISNFCPVQHELGAFKTISYIAVAVPLIILVAKATFRMIRKPHTTLPLTRKAIRISTPSWQSSEGRQLIRNALNTLPKRALNALLIERRQKESSDKSLEEYLAVDLQGGTCYGQSMNILETLCLTSSEEISEETVTQNMDLEKIVRYQIAHQLHIFLQNQNSAFAYGVMVQPMCAAIEAIFPHSNRIVTFTERMELTKYTEKLFTGRLSDFLLRDMKPVGQEPKQSENFFIQILFQWKRKSGHCALLYYNRAAQRFYLYDPYYRSDGLLSTSSRREFIDGVAKHVMRYKNLEFSSVQLFSCTTGQ